MRRDTICCWKAANKEKKRRMDLMNEIGMKEEREEEMRRKSALKKSVIVQAIV